MAYSEASVCKWGPSYWCQSRTTARQCGQEKYCQDNVWKVCMHFVKTVCRSIECIFMYVVFFFLHPPLVQASLKAKLSSSPLDTCSTCKLVAQVLKGFIDNNKTEVHSVCVHSGCTSCLQSVTKPCRCSDS